MRRKSGSPPFDYSLDFDPEKAAAAAIFYERYVAARQHPEYVRQKKQHQTRYEDTGRESS
jgi:hypothetical protein